MNKEQEKFINDALKTAPGARNTGMKEFHNLFYTAGDPHHQRSTLEMIQKARKTATINIAIRHGLRLPVPIPNAWPALRDVCSKELPNAENRSPWVIVQ
ncbi:hypothetical protein CVT26_014565 [Gymnopilus dilepis]|uniref:Uncharacterized protein n=1 Tax=Gymnopilus dilepis TaxID=231916 RepID=A0A409VVI5_9AGAR|nr:hypothetical protein CVT26_014565 [Gymnopilus dilepis]